jgi:addiction module HigA family antidote
MEMHNPPHPGEILKEDYLVPLGLSITAAASALGVTRQALSALVNGRGGVSPEMAIRLSKALNTSPQLWLNLQQQFDLWQAQQRADEIHVESLVPRAA